MTVTVQPSEDALAEKGRADANKVRNRRTTQFDGTPSDTVKQRTSMGTRAAWWKFLSRKQKSIPRTFLKFFSFGHSGKPKGIAGLTGTALSKEQSRRAKKGVKKRARNRSGQFTVTVRPATKRRAK